MSNAEQETEAESAPQESLWSRVVDRLPEENVKRDALIAGSCGMFLAGVAIITVLT